DREELPRGRSLRRGLRRGGRGVRAEGRQHDRERGEEEARETRAGHGGRTPSEDRPSPRPAEGDRLATIRAPRAGGPAAPRPFVGAEGRARAAEGAEAGPHPLDYKPPEGRVKPPCKPPPCPDPARPAPGRAAIAPTRLRPPAWTRGRCRTARPTPR